MPLGGGEVWNLPGPDSGQPTIQTLPVAQACGLEGSFGLTDSVEAVGQRFKLYRKRWRGYCCPV